MSNVEPIPKGYSAVTPHLVVKGAAEAIDFYKKAFGATERGRMPGPDGKTLMHAEIEIGGSPVMLADEFPQWGSVSPKTLNGSPVTINLYVQDVDKVFNQAVAAGATVTMPLANQFWGDRYGKLADPFGHQWALATHVEDVPPEQMKERASKMFAAAPASAS